MNDAKTILITGASSGIGLAAARQLAADGAALIMVSRDPVGGGPHRRPSGDIPGNGWGDRPYFFHGRASRSKAITYDAGVAALLWAVSEELAHLGEPLAPNSLLEVLT